MTKITKTGTANDLDPVKAYENFKRRTKDNQRVELDHALEPYRAAIGEEIENLRNERQWTLAEVATYLNMTNRTFMYECLRAYNRALATPGSPIAGSRSPRPTIPAPKAEEPVSESPYIITWINDNPQTVLVEVPWGTYSFAADEVPDEWAEASPERRVIYKEILREINDI